MIRTITMNWKTKMPIKANEEAHSPSSKGDAECESAPDSNERPASVNKDTSCTCDSDSEDEWETDTEELLHVEINGIFQVGITFGIRITFTDMKSLLISHSNINK